LKALLHVRGPISLCGSEAQRKDQNRQLHCRWIKRKLTEEGSRWVEKIFVTPEIIMVMM
jgi:hypothetical protein